MFKLTSLNLRAQKHFSAALKNTPGSPAHKLQAGAVQSKFSLDLFSSSRRLFMKNKDNLNISNMTKKKKKYNK